MPESTPPRPASAARRRHTHRPTHFVGPGLAHPASRRQLTAELITELAGRLTSRDRWLLELLHEHRVLTTPQIHQLAFPSIRTASQRMLTLWQLRAVERFRPARPIGSAPMHYVLGPAGAAALAAARQISLAELGYRPDHAQAIAHSQHLDHMVGANGIFTALAAHARGQPRYQLATWWSERRCARHWGQIVRPDGYGAWTRHHTSNQHNTGHSDGHSDGYGDGHGDEHGAGRTVDFFVEYDRGTEPLDRLLGKLGDYTALATATGITTTWLLFTLPSTQRETHLHARLTSPTGGTDLLVATSHTAALTAPNGPADPVWWPLTASPRNRLRLSDLPTAAPHTRDPRHHPAAPAEGADR